MFIANFDYYLKTLDQELYLIPYDFHLGLDKNISNSIWFYIVLYKNIYYLDLFLFLPSKQRLLIWIYLIPYMNKSGFSQKKSYSIWIYKLLIRKLSL